MRILKGDTKKDELIQTLKRENATLSKQLQLQTSQLGTPTQLSKSGLGLGSQIEDLPDPEPVQPPLIDLA